MVADATGRFISGRADRQEVDLTLPRSERPRVINVIDLDLGNLSYYFSVYPI